MEVIDSAVKWAVGIANDNSHGYDQANRWGPDYDCSSLVISAFKQAGVKLTCTYTGNMKLDFLKNGFKDVTSKVNMYTGEGFEKGDVLLAHNNSHQHTALYIGDGNIVQASINEYGRVTGGKSGDQTNGEIATKTYYNCPWDTILRYTNTVTESTTEYMTYVIKYGDNLWDLAKKYLGDGNKYSKIIEANHMGAYPKVIPGDTIVIPVEKEVGENVTVSLPIIGYGCVGITVRKLQTVLNLIGYSLDVDGDFGSLTKDALKAFQKANGLAQSGVTDAKTWEALLK